VPPSIRDVVGVTNYELDVLARALTVEHRDKLVAAGWGDDLGTAVGYALWWSQEVRELWETRLTRVPRGLEAGWERTVALMFWDKAVPVLVARPRELPEPKSRNQKSATRSRRRKQTTRTTYGHPEKKYPRSQVVDAIHRWREGGENRNVSEISRRTKLSRQVLERIGRLDQAGAFELGPRGGLLVPGTDRKFRAAGASISIRALERALDLPPPAYRNEICPEPNRSFRAGRASLV
jgi:hypothetical protein